MVVTSMVIADGRVIATHWEIQVFVKGIGEQEALDIDTENIVLASLEHHLTQELEFVRQIGGDEKVHLAKGEGSCSAFLGAAEKVSITESSDAQQRLVQVHRLGLGMRSCRLSLRVGGSPRGVKGSGGGG